MMFVINSGYLIYIRRGYLFYTIGALWIFYKDDYLYIRLIIMFYLKGGYRF